MRLACLLVALAGCLEAPPASGDAADPAGKDGGVEQDAGSGCPIVVADEFDEPIDTGVWIEQILNQATITTEGGRVTLRAQGIGEDQGRADLLSFAERPVAGTHLVATLVHEDDDQAYGRSSLAWFRPASANYYSIHALEDEVYAAYVDNTEGPETWLCQQNDDCPAYADGMSVVARLSATETDVTMSVSIDGAPWHTFPAAPNTGEAFAIRTTAHAFAPTTVELHVDAVAWYDCPPVDE